MTNKLMFRPVNETDWQYVINSWMHVARNNERHSYMSNEDYRDYFKAHVVQLLARPDVFVQVAYIDPEDDYILAFLVHSFDIKGRLVLHHIQIRDVKTFGHNGLATKLIKSIQPDLTKPIIVTQYSKLLPSFLKKYPQLSYNPYPALKGGA